ncbi:MAG TPA: hypothetical protein VI612_02165 [Candidatus Nanoarchaeia archaeon]|nr:hypothetical protein [Candidatus Nanoarchaeia archaeon]
MSQEMISEFDMDVFSRRIGPYFSWLESRIESGWEQSDSIPKDVLKEVKYLATTMRARFILGVSKDDFSKEVQRAVELFELAEEAFPSEGEEIETKTKHFCKGVSEEIGSQFLPEKYREPRPPVPPSPHPFPEPEPMPEPEPFEPPEEDKKAKVEKVRKIKLEKPKIAKVEIKVQQEPKVEIKIEKQVKKSISKPKVAGPKVEVVKKVEKAPVVKAKKSGRKKSFFLVRWAKSFIFGED